MPKSEFLRAFLAENVPLVGSELAEANLVTLLGLTQDADLSNRNWATFILAQEAIDTEMVRETLINAARDSDIKVRAEAVLGLAIRDARVALPFVQEALRDSTVNIVMLEAAGICAHPSLVDDLRVWAEPSDHPSVDKAAAKALRSCEAALTN